MLRARHRSAPAAALLAAVALVAPIAPAAGDAAAGAATIDLESLRVPYERFVLPNGLTVLVHTDHSVPIVAVNLWYHVGSQNEQRGRTGFAHLFEHFFFNGSEHHPHGFREAMDDLGANNRNGTTSTDRTNFFEDVPVGALERTLYLEADRMGFLAAQISQEMLERERGVVSNEKRQGENQPYGRVFSRVVESLYPASHPYSWPTIGSLEDLAAATLDDVQQWYATYYGPNNCVLSLAGDLTVERARELVTRYFGGIPPGPALPRYERWVPRLDGDVRDTLEDRVPQARVYRAWHAPGWGEPGFAEMQLAAEVLSGSKSARLDRRLVYDKELATDAFAFLWDKELTSTLFVAATAKPGVDLRELERELDAAVTELLADGPTADELARARTRLLAGFARGIERLGGFGGRSDVLAESQTFGGDPHAYLAIFAAQRDATPAAVRETAREWLGRHHLTLTVTPAPDLATGETTVDRTALPPLGEPAAPKFPEIQRAKLSNGLGVILLERHTAPLVNLALTVDAGSASDAAAEAGLASLALDLLTSGTAKRDTFALEDELDRLGARLTTDTGLDASNVRLRALAATLSPALDLFAEVVRQPAFPAEQFELERRRRLARIRQEQAQPVAAALRLMPPILYGSEHPYGKPLTGSGSEATVSALERDDLARWHATWVRPASATLVVAGDVTLAELLPELERTLGAWPAGRAPAKQLAAPAAAPRGKVYLVDKPDAPQSVIVASHVSIRGGRPDDVAVDTVMRLFGGMATSRLNRNLRLDKHWSYGTSGFLSDARGERPLLVVAPVQTDKTREAMVEVEREIRGIAGARPVEGQELANILRGSTARLPGRFETLAALEDAALDLVAYGYPDDWWARYGERVRALGAADLAAAGAAAVRPDEVVWLVIGDRARIEGGLRELALGEIVPLDPQGNPASAARE
jgi:zinc protease